MFKVLKRTVSLRRFFWVPLTYVLIEKWKKIIFDDPLLSGGLCQIDKMLGNSTHSF